MMFVSTGDAEACMCQIQAKQMNTKIQPEKKCSVVKEELNVTKLIGKKESHQDCGVCRNTTATGCDDLNIGFNQIV